MHNFPWICDSVQQIYMYIIPFCILLQSDWSMIGEALIVPSWKHFYFDYLLGIPF